MPAPFGVEAGDLLAAALCKSLIEAIEYQPRVAASNSWILHAEPASTCPLFAWPCQQSGTDLAKPSTTRSFSGI
jgi:hypothetical protein